MPFTPYHFGPALFFGLLFFKHLNFATFLLSSVIIDIEPFLIVYFNFNYPLHGFLHSFLGGTLVAVVFSALMIKLDKRIQRIAKLFRLEQNFSPKVVFLSSFSGIYLHILLDSFLYADIKPFFPFEINPLLNVFTGFEIYTFSATLFIIGLILYASKILRK